MTSTQILQCLPRFRPARSMARIVVIAIGCALLATLPACRDELAPPTQGTLALDFGAWTDVEVFVDGVSQGTDITEFQLDAGTYVVRVARDCFSVAPGLREVRVEPGHHAVAAFQLEPQEFGTVRITATHELTGEEVVGAAVLRETSPGLFQSTGQTTPAVISDVPCGTSRFQVGGALYEASPQLTVEVDTGSDTQRDVTLSPLRAVLAEMFTYVGCPNCPPAADTLASLNTQFPVEVYVVEWHVVPGRPLYDARWVERQHFYTGGVNHGYPATIFQGLPPLIVNGELSSRLEYKVRVAEVLDDCAGDCPLAIESTADFTAGAAAIDVWLKGRSASLPGDLRLRFVLLEGDIVYPGVPPFHFVPRSYEEQSISLPTSGQVVTFSASLGIDPGWNASHLSYVVYVQSEATGEILAVDGNH